ncbi:hypothetical protein LB579_29255 [Mesorhizobium sp. BR1-1-7]|uniref:DUF4376 domain-containing protein n=1 Tax=Mesorhizobium sp. BR1-1-7 TaxID=2876647 RepID=UPI001CCDD2DD|nr:hypothetical protein [Mesorhizobium sp. BR1-1-7]MBZ9921783.1 hypothetical protein [Mesorhizobium sp. BR1-1-7]
MDMIFCKVEAGVVTNRAVFEDGMPAQWAEPGETWVASDTAQIGWLFDGGSFTAPPSSLPPPTMIDVNRERDRRLSAGFEYDFGGDRGVHHVGTDAADMVGWDEVTKLSSALLATGDTSTTIKIATNSGVADVTAEEWQQVLLAAGAFRQPIWQASFLLGAADPIPADYAADKWWTASPSAG